MIEKIVILTAGVLIGIVTAIVIFRKEIIQFIDYHDNMPGLNDIGAMLAIDPVSEKKQRLKNLRHHLNRVENTDYPGDYGRIKQETIVELKKRIRQVESSEEDFTRWALKHGR